LAGTRKGNHSGRCKQANDLIASRVLPTIARPSTGAAENDLVIRKVQRQCKIKPVEPGNGISRYKRIARCERSTSSSIADAVAGAIKRNAAANGSRSRNECAQFRIGTPLPRRRNHLTEV
jgi:hypothetical protein